MKRLTPNMMVEDIDRAVEFYIETLGFEIVLKVSDEDGCCQWAMLARDGIEFMFQTRASISKEFPILEEEDIGGSLCFFILVEDIQGLYAGLKDRVSLVKELHTTFYGTQEFAIQDPDGYILAFAEGGKAPQEHRGDQM